MFFRFMAGVIMIVGAMISLVFMMMSVGSSAMLMFVVMLMVMIVGMIMTMFVTVFHVLMRMLMGVFMLMTVIVLMIVFVFSFHRQFSCISGLLWSFK